MTMMSARTETNVQPRRLTLMPFRYHGQDLLDVEITQFDPSTGHHTRMSQLRDVQLVLESEINV